MQGPATSYKSSTGSTARVWHMGRVFDLLSSVPLTTNKRKAGGPISSANPQSNLSHADSMKDLGTRVPLSPHGSPCVRLGASACERSQPCDGHFKATDTHCQCFSAKHSAEALGAGGLGSEMPRDACGKHDISMTLKRQLYLPLESTGTLQLYSSPSPFSLIFHARLFVRLAGSVSELHVH